MPPMRSAIVALVLTATTGFTHCDQLPRNVAIEGATHEDVLTSAQVIALDVLTYGLDVARIELYDGRHKMGEVEGSAYAYSWNVTAEDNGRHKWQAFAYDVDGILWPSMPVSVTVEIAPARSAGPPPGTTGKSPGMEAACAALGEACVCSEPLDQAQALNFDFNNPSDSPPESECFGGDSFHLGGGGETVPAFGMPAGSTASTVWRIDYGGSYTIASLNGDSTTLDQGTVCTRIYQRFSDDYPLMGSVAFEERNKMLELSGSWGQFQSEFWGPTADAVFSPRGTVYGTSFSRRLDASGGAVSIPDCKGSWCRFEQCIDRSGSTATFRTRATVVNTGETVVHDSGPIGGVGPMHMETVWIGNLYREVVTAGSRYISHGMQAHWRDSTGHWIGAALEVEP